MPPISLAPPAVDATGLPSRVRPSQQAHPPSTAIISLLAATTMPNFVAFLINNPIIQLISFLITLGTIATVIINIYLIGSGLAPILLRLGKSLASRKIAVLAEEKESELIDLLVDSGLFKRKNILTARRSDINRAKDCTIKLVHWERFKEDIDKILNMKGDNHALIVYAPAEGPRISKENMDKLSMHRNTVIVNFRGRLLNDILTSMLTTQFSKR
jgi:hypothetical protein